MIAVFQGQFLAFGLEVQIYTELSEKNTIKINTKYPTTPSWTNPFNLNAWKDCGLNGTQIFQLWKNTIRIRKQANSEWT